MIDVAVRWPDTLWHQARLLYNPRSWRDILDAINRLAILREPTFVWRGHESTEWNLSPSIYRKLRFNPPIAQSSRDAIANQVGCEVDALMRRARGHAHDIVDGRVIVGLTLLALLQHSGAATPLLDVTADPLVALFFACKPGPNDDEDGVLLAIDARNNRMLQFDAASTEPWNEALQRLQDENRTLGLYVPPMVTPRILAQRGRFIFGNTGASVEYSTLPVGRYDGWNYERLRRLFGLHGAGRPAVPPVVAIRVPSTDKSRLREVLRVTFGLTDESLFPDLAGFANANDVAGPRLSI